MAGQTAASISKIFALYQYIIGFQTEGCGEACRNKTPHLSRNCRNMSNIVWSHSSVARRRIC
jgi:hypothetical protein